MDLEVDTDEIRWVLVVGVDAADLGGGDASATSDGFSGDG